MEERIRQMKKQLVMVCLFVLAVFLLPVHALGESPFFTEDITLVPAADKGESQYLFLYTGTDEGWSRSNKVSLDINCGIMNVKTVRNGHESKELYYAYPPMEVRVWRWESAGQQWIREQKFDIYSDSGETITFAADNAVYCLHLYFWKPDTVVKSYHENHEFYYHDDSFLPCIHKTGVVTFGDVVGGYWASGIGEPVVTVSAGETVVFHQGNPTPLMPKE